MGIEATVLELANALSLVEMLARNLTHYLFVLFHQIILLWATLDHLSRGNNEVTISPTDWTGSEMVLPRSLVIGRTPSSDAIQAESVIAAI